MIRRLLCSIWLWAPAIFALLATGCDSAAAPVAPAQDAATTAANVAPAAVQEVLRGDGQVYVRVVEGQWDFWFMAPEAPVKPGDFVLLGKGPLRTHHRSAELDRTFAELVVLDAFSVVDEVTAAASLRLPPLDDGLSVAQVYAQRQALAGETVRVRGRIAKANKGIFGKNWYHLQDGTGDPDAGTHDLTVTSQAELEVGDLAIAEGALTIDRDLGFGYFYEAIIEEGSLVATRL